MKMHEDKMESLPKTIVWATEQRKKARKEGQIEAVEWWNLVIPSLERALEMVRKEYSRDMQTRSKNWR